MARIGSQKHNVGIKFLLCEGFEIGLVGKGWVWFLWFLQLGLQMWNNLSEGEFHVYTHGKKWFPENSCSWTPSKKMLVVVSPSKKMLECDENIWDF